MLHAGVTHSSKTLPALHTKATGITAVGWGASGYLAQHYSLQGKVRSLCLCLSCRTTCMSSLRC